MSFFKPFLTLILFIISSQHLKCATQLIGNVLLLSDDIIAPAEESIQSASTLLEILDDLLLGADLEGEDSLSVVTPNMALALREVDIMRTGDQWYVLNT